MASDFLQSAFDLADDYRHRATFSKAADSASMLTGGRTYGIDSGYSKLTQSKEQLAHFRGWVYVAIGAIAKKIAGQAVCIGRIKATPTRRKLFNLPDSLKSAADNLEPLTTHPLLLALADPNPIQVRSTLIYSTVAALLLTGRSHWWIDDTSDKLLIWPIPPHWLRPSDPMRGSWFLRPDGATDETELPNDAIATFMLPDPASPFSCVSPLQSQAAAVSTDEAIQKTQFETFKSGVHPQLAIRIGKLPDPMGGGRLADSGERPRLEPQQRIELVESILQLYGGSANRNNPLIVDGLIEGFDKLSATPQEMDFLASGQATKARILQAFGVNPIIVGEIENANRASAAVASQLFAENTVNPIIELMSEVLTEWIAKRYGDNLACWIEPARANDPELRLNEWKAAASEGFVTPNEFRQAVLGIGPIEGGDVRTDAFGNLTAEADDKYHLPEFSRNGHGTH